MKEHLNDSRKRGNALKNTNKDRLYFFLAFGLFIVITVLLVGFLLLFGGCGGSGSYETGCDTEIREVSIRYEVEAEVCCTCERPVVEIWYKNESGGYTTIEEFIPPWKYNFRYSTGQQVGCMATYYGEQEIELTVRLYQDNKLVDEMYSKGRNAIVSYVDKIIE